ncbi:E3 SUMO-protein ligase ZBED1-like [Prorops nasuta]|uniref:E3 SUMO-protein ligase ZBED1-like n=1 Tax=Prorops nasuta TaxID=863751 RepID=UPI0034CED2F5
MYGGEIAMQLTNAIIFMIAKDNCPLNIVEKEGFQKLIKIAAPLYAMSSRKCITKLIEDKYTALVSIVLHFVSENSLKSVTLGVMPLSERHTANNIGIWLLELLETWQIKNESVVVIVSVNASNMTKAIKDTFGESRFLSCFAHSLNLVAMQLIVDKVVKEILDKIKTIVTYFKHSVIATDHLRKNSELKLIQSVSTRWNSTYYMLERFMELSLIIGFIMLDIPESPPMLSATELQVTAMGEKMRCLLITTLEERFKQIKNKNILSIATILDPRFKLLHFKDQLALSSTISYIKNELRLTKLLDTSENNCLDLNAVDLDDNDIWSHHKRLLAAENK